MPILARDLFGYTERLAVRHYRHFLDRIGGSGEPRHDRMAGFVIGNEPALLWIDEMGMSGTKSYLVVRLLEIAHAYRARVTPRGCECSLVAQIGQIRPTQAGCHPRQSAEVYIGRQFQLAGVDAHDALAAIAVGQADDDLTVETPRAQQCGIQDVGAITRGQDNDVLPL